MQTLSCRWHSLYLTSGDFFLSALQLTGHSTDPSEVCEGVKTTKPFLPGDEDSGRSGTALTQPTGQWLLTKIGISICFGGII